MANPMLIGEITLSILGDLEKFADHSRVEMVAINHPTSMKVLGLMVPQQRKIVDLWRKKLSDLSVDNWIELALNLVNTDILECQQVAYEFVWKNKKVLQALSVSQIVALGKNPDNWVSVDMYCLSITGYSWRTGKLSDPFIKQWAASENRWLRRTALVSTVPLNLRARGGTGDVERTLEICSLLLTDYDDMIVKAMSWALRELSKTHKEPVRNFVDVHRRVLHNRIIREVETKLNTGKKTIKVNKFS